MIKIFLHVSHDETESIGLSTQEEFDRVLEAFGRLGSDHHGPCISSLVDKRWNSVGPSLVAGTDTR